MEVAIHKETGKHVSAWKIANSLEWKGKERDEFIAPYHEIGNWEELKKKNINEVNVSFIIKHIRHYSSGETFVAPHFRIETEGAKENLENESEEHLLAKQEIYSKAIQDNILLKIKNDGTKKISEIGEIEDIKIERGVGRKRADVLITFKNKNLIYGNGIAFEIQISPQSDKETIKRSYDRASYGYSIVWIWSNELDLNNTYNLIPYNEALEEYKKQIKEDINEELWDISKRTNEKIKDIKISINEEVNLLRLKREQFKQDINSSIEILTKIYENINNETKEKIEKRVIQNIEDFNFSDTAEKYFLNNLDKKLVSFLQDKNGIILGRLNQILDEKINLFLNNNKEEIQNLINNKFEEILKNYDSKYKNSIQQKVDTDLKNISSNFKTQIKTEVKNEVLKSISELCEEYVNKNVINHLRGDLLKLKTESMDSYSKNKIIYYLICSNCKQEKHISCFNISKNKDLICLECYNKDGEKEKTNKNKTHY